MIRTLTVAAALIAGFALPALAADTAVNANTGTTQGIVQQNLFTSDQTRQHLMHLGYTEVSSLTKDEDGKWIGRATKDGKSFIVAVDIKGPVHAKPALTN